MHPNARRSQACLLQYRDRRQLPILPTTKCTAPTSDPPHESTETPLETTDDASADAAAMCVENCVLKAQLAALRDHDGERNRHLTSLQTELAALRARSIALEAELRVLRHLVRRTPMHGSL
ncbi:hypothetical protein SPRG_05549 [Saprolegnia parasitica CBS 223.65]|uniref:Uncharacterized protein n=1 Tax=Saprolegnia parasitica (strain CBS 223.65) TaxID=695850 RepID=A0A067CSU4_SAPPC|nr:hypothetical protein SPRG_05549 [Saprolegnia parasitica CBS 223.65]KDO29596.1 hypothetical protein SPRG_05549 [Saprolegnia parasitica CBS 223.65]|eukprot:XP_012199657.1 hypothetical protein SPRG_05549 [Saprolegnia parasitica CBS 223.65]